MAKTATIHARIDEKIKEDAIAVFDSLGLSVADAITLYFRQVAIKNGIPFELTAAPVPRSNFELISTIKQGEVKKVLDVLPDSVDEVWVFGSAVTAYCRPESDIDVCVVGDYITKDDRRIMAHAPRHGMDLIDVSHAVFDSEKNNPGSIFNEVFSKGLLIYRKGEGLVDAKI